MESDRHHQYIQQYMYMRVFVSLKSVEFNYCLSKLQQLLIFFLCEENFDQKNMGE